MRPPLALITACVLLISLGCKGGAQAPVEPGKRQALDYRNTCGACHGANGGGTPGIYPPLKGHLNGLLAAKGGRQYVLEAAVHGLRGPIVVKDTPYDAWMPKVAAATNETVARALTHAALTFGEVDEGFKPYTKEEVEAERGREQTPMDTWTHRPKGLREQRAPGGSVDTQAPPSNP